MNGVRRVLYQLQKVAHAPLEEIVFFTEGEKDCDRLLSLDLVATTNPGGAANYKNVTSCMAQYLAGRRVVILQDNDDAGAEHVAAGIALMRSYAATVVGLKLDGLPPKADVSDWLNNGGTPELLLELAATALAGGTPPEPSADDDEDGKDAAAPNRRKSKRDDPPSEDDVALAFTDRHRDTLRFDHDIGMWLEWDGSRWRPDNRHRAFTYARELARQQAAAGGSNFAAGVERFARADPVHAVNADIWDADPMLLGTPGGVLDLRAGKLLRARPDTFITKLTSCTPESGEPELWLRFLKEALADDVDAIRFLKLWAGYCLTGDTREHALLFLHGLSGTGKTVFLNTLSNILGDYAVTAAMETFTASKYDRHSTELAMLRGARLVTASETEEGRAWAEARIKQITGGDPITARFMRQDNFTYRPQFKLTIVGNHAPRLTNPDDAMRRRFNILGFNVKPAEPDLQLEEKLRPEHGRILAWALEGCVEWQASGLVRPTAVQDATTEYFAGEDLMGQWLAEHCDIRPGVFELPAKLYRDWQGYAQANGEDPGTAIGFGKKMAKRGLGAKVASGIRAHRGVALRKKVEARDDL